MIPSLLFALLLNMESGVELDWDSKTLREMPAFIPLNGWRRKVDGPPNIGVWVIQTLSYLRHVNPRLFGKPPKSVNELSDDWIP